MARSSDTPPASSHIYRIGETEVAVTLHEPGRPVPSVPEALVHDLWAHQQFDASALQTTDGRPVRILDPGQLNTDAGADFREAHLQIGELEWHGDVEIHTTSGDWFAHTHHRDPRYNSVILHVTLHPDQWTGRLQRANGSPLPEVVLYPHLHKPLRTLLHAFHTQDSPSIPCAAQWSTLPNSDQRAWVRHLGQERIRTKMQALADAYIQRPDVEALLYERLFAGLGYAKNDAPMVDLARRLPLPFARQWAEVSDLEALYFGVAGLLPAPGDLLDADRATADYAMALRRRWGQLQARFNLTALSRERWTFFRLRPANFPPIRIAQGVALVSRGGLLHQDPIGTLLDAATSDAPIAALRDCLEAAPPSFWTTHVRLIKSTTRHTATIGRSRRDTLLINAVLPVLLLVAEQYERPGLTARILELVDRLPAERDSTTRVFADLGLKPRSALESQGMHRLHRDFCSSGGCLQCAIGKQLLAGG